MKSKKIFAALLAAALTATAVVSASAVSLTDKNPDGDTEVHANIDNTTPPGEVAYEITVPDKVDFGTLAVAESETPNYKFINFKVTATQMNVTSSQAVNVTVKDSSAPEDNQFYLTQQLTEGTPFTIGYDLYDDAVSAENMASFTAVNKTDMGETGYDLATFVGPSSQGSAQDVTLALNQTEVYNKMTNEGKTLDDITGDYKGNLTFHTSLRTFSI